MQKIDFHHNVPNRIIYACQVAATVYRRNMTLAVWSTNAERLAQFNAQLWERDPLSFIPHLPAEHPKSAQTPVRFSTNLNALEGDVLLLLDDALPPAWEQAFQRFSRIIDVVSTDEAELRASRARYLAYKHAGVELAAYDRRAT